MSDSIQHSIKNESFISNKQEKKVRMLKKNIKKSNTEIQTQTKQQSVSDNIKKVKPSCALQISNTQSLLNETINSQLETLSSPKIVNHCAVETKEILFKNLKKNPCAKKKIKSKNLKIDNECMVKNEILENVINHEHELVTMTETDCVIDEHNSVDKKILYTGNISSRSHTIFDDDYIEPPVKKQCDEQRDPVEEEFLNVLRNHHIIFSKDFVIENHLLWYGPSESNKKNLVRFFLSNYYNERNMRVEKHIFTISNHHDNLNVVIYKSQFHWEIDFRWTGNNTNNSTNKNSNDEYIIDYFNNHFCKTCSINLNTFKVLVFFNSHRLTYNNQKMILRIMENTFRNVKFIIITDQINKIDTTIKSRCINIRIPLLFDNIFYYINLNGLTHKFNLFKYDMKNTIQNNPHLINQYISEAILTSKSNKYKQSIETKVSSDIKNCNVSEKEKYHTQDNPMEIFFDQKINTALQNQGLWAGNSEKIFLKNLFEKISRLKASLDSINFQEMYQSVIDDIDNYLLSCHTIQEFLKNFVIYLNESHQKYMTQKYGPILKNISQTSCPEYNQENLKFLKSISVYLTRFAEIEYISQKCDYQIYSIESFLSFYLME